MTTPATKRTRPIALEASDVLVLVDVQRDFVSGTLAVPDAPAAVPVLARYVREFARRGLPIVATRDWHPSGHCSFRDRGGPWPPHCIAGTPGAGFDERLSLGPDAIVISKAVSEERDAYSGFEGTELDLRLRKLGARRLFVGGLATDYCVRATVHDALEHGYEVFLLLDGIRAVNVKPGDGERAIAAMQAEGAVPIRYADLVGAMAEHG
jgi:nicotinamidase/pyrazinamidase